MTVFDKVVLGYTPFNPKSASQKAASDNVVCLKSSAAYFSNIFDECKYKDKVISKQLIEKSLIRQRLQDLPDLGLLCLQKCSKASQCVDVNIALLRRWNVCWELLSALS